jgi:DNA invertase Pin-like site-specific DNA recombinase
MRVIGYARVSTEEQALDGVSLEDQRRRIQMYCGLHGHELAGIEVDAGFSGKDFERAGAQRVLELFRTKGIDGLVVTKLNRWTRSLRDLLDTVDDAEKRRIAFLSIDESLDTSTPQGRFVIKLFGSLAELEREEISYRTKAALEHKRVNGEKLGGKVPYGCRVEVGGNGKKRLIEDEHEQAVIRYVLEARGSEMTLEGIAGALNEAGFRTREGGPFVRQYIHRIVRRMKA